MDFFLVSYFINNQLFVHSCEQSSQFFTAQPQIRTPGWEGNFLITASSKDKTFCHLLYSLQKQKPPVKIIKNIKTCCQNIKTNCQNHQKHQNLLSKHQNHQNLLSKHQNHLSKSSKPTVNNIKTIKTTCQKHQNLLS